VQSLALALDDDDAALIKQRWEQLCGMLRQRRDDGAIKKLLTDDQAARLDRMTSFTV
jgi:hypothetical protein